MPENIKSENVLAFPEITQLITVEFWLYAKTPSAPNLQNRWGIVAIQGRMDWKVDQTGG
jgi:hypothetical protein